MAIVRAFHKHRGVGNLSMPDLIDLLREQIPLIAPSQTRYRVTTIPTARTIRFYTARGIVDKPLALQGTEARYGYRHLLQLLAVKYLQAQYLPLAKIESLMAGASNPDLELLMPQIAPATHRGLAREDRTVVGIVGGKRSTGAETPANARPPTAVDQATGEAVGAEDLWRRIEVSPGVELQVHAAWPAGARERLRVALLAEVGRIRGWRD